MIPVQIEDWRTYHRDGLQFMNTAVQARQKKRKAFSAETLYNLTCMSIEKLVMAFLMSRGDLAENHTMHDLGTALLKHLGHDDELAGKFDYLDTFQEICDPEEANLRHPGEQDVNTIIKIGTDVQRLLEPYFAGM